MRQANPGGLEPPNSNRRTCRDTGPAVLRLACNHTATAAVITGGSGMWTFFVGCSCPSCQSRPVTGSLICTGCDGWHTECTARQGRKAPQEEDLASIDTVLRFYSTGVPLRNAGAAQPRPRLPAHPLIHSAERERHGDRTSLNPGNAWPSRLHLPVDVNGPATGTNPCGRRGSVSMSWRGKATAQHLFIGNAQIQRR